MAKKKTAKPSPLAAIEPVTVARQTGGTGRIPKYPTEGWCAYELRANGVKVGDNGVKFEIEPMIKALRGLGYDVEKYSKPVVSENNR